MKLIKGSQETFYVLPTIAISWDTYKGKYYMIEVYITWLRWWVGLEVLIDNG